jgi:hypothetical protein
MTSYPVRPAAYVPAGGDAARQAVIRAAHQRGWPAPEIYDGEDPAHGDADQALRALDCAVASGRHDAVLMTVPPDPSPLMRLLARCTRNGVRVTFLPSVVRPAEQSAVEPSPGRSQVTCPGAAHPTENWDVLAKAQLEAMAGLFPGWRIWLDAHGWHARRRGDGFVEQWRPGAPAFHVQASSAVDLAAQLCWQRAADEHAPRGCEAARR